MLARVYYLFRYRRCANGCGRMTMHRRGRFCLECLSGSPPLSCPALVPTAYLVACFWELVARFGPAKARRPEIADRAWWALVRSERAATRGARS